MLSNEMRESQRKMAEDRQTEREAALNAEFQQHYESLQGIRDAESAC